MNFLYVFLVLLFAIIFISAISFFLVLTFSRSKKTGFFPVYKVNLVKKFLTFCYHLIREENVSEEKVLVEFLNLLQKIFEARFVAYFSLSGGKEVLKYHSESFFPYTYGINSLRDLLVKNGLKVILTKEQIYLLELDQNKHRLSIPISVSSISDPGSRKIVEGINSDTIVLVPIYRTSELEGLYIVFTRSGYFSKENESIVNILIDYVSLVLVVLSSKDTIEKLFTSLRLGLVSSEVHFEIDKDIKSTVTKTLLEVSRLVDIPLLIVSKSDDKVILANNSFIRWFGDDPTGKELSEALAKYKAVSDNVVFSGTGIFEMKKVVLPNLEVYGVIFYRSYMLDERVMSSVYNELLEIRKYFAFVNKISVPRGRDDVFVRYQPNDKIAETGGDTFIFVEYGKKIFFGVFDVSGHDISSGFVALVIKSFAEDFLKETGDILITASKLNELLVGFSEEDINLVYVTGMVCELDREKGVVRYVCAGHKYGIILKKDSIIDISRVSTVSKPFGISSESKFTVNTIEVSSGDKIFLYTDGIVEIEDEKGLTMDSSKIIDLIIFCKEFTVKDTVNEIFAYIKSLKSVKVVDDFLIFGLRV